MAVDLLRELYLEWIEDYCNVLFDSENLPAGVKLALDELVSTDPLQFGVTSEKIADMSVTYGGVDGSIPSYILNWISQYRRPYLASDKDKKPYDSGR